MYGVREGAIMRKRYILIAFTTAILASTMLARAQTDFSNARANFEDLAENFGLSVDEIMLAIIPVGDCVNAKLPYAAERSEEPRSIALYLLSDACNGQMIDAVHNLTILVSRSGRDERQFERKFKTFLIDMSAALIADERKNTKTRQ
jgi:hypothetical protein